MRHRTLSLITCDAASQLSLMRDCLGRANDQWCLWLDCDTLVMNTSITVESIIHTATAATPACHGDGGRRACSPLSSECNCTELVISEDATLLNTGVFLLRSSAWSRGLLDELLGGDASVMSTHPFWDQAAM